VMEAVAVPTGASGPPPAEPSKPPAKPWWHFW
jgi:hypothetical protein